MDTKGSAGKERIGGNEHIGRNEEKGRIIKIEARKGGKEKTTRRRGESPKAKSKACRRH